MKMQIHVNYVRRNLFIFIKIIYKNKLLLYNTMSNKNELLQEPSNRLTIFPHIMVFNWEMYKKAVSAFLYISQLNTMICGKCIRKQLVHSGRPKN